MNSETNLTHPQIRPGSVNIVKWMMAWKNTNTVLTAAPAGRKIHFVFLCDSQCFLLDCCTEQLFFPNQQNITAILLYRAHSHQCFAALRAGQGGRSGALSSGVVTSRLLVKDSHL